MSTVETLGEQRVVMEPVRWSTYVALLEDASFRRGRMNYDRGVLEIMSPSKSHEQIACLIGRMIETFTEERQIEIVSVASLTVKLESLQRGFEADEAYYIRRADQVRGLEELDFTLHPAPDLLVEVDISHSSIGKLPIFAAFGVLEVWRYRDASLTVCQLKDNGYRETSQSDVLPGFPLEVIGPVLARRNEVGETQLIRSFRESLRVTG
jgi:Uma2 family endonuclease